MIKQIMCWILGHDYDMTFPDKKHPFDWVFVCKRCGRVTRNMWET